MLVDRVKVLVIKTKSGQRKKIATKGWKFLVQWKDGLQSWIPFVDLQESYLVQLAEYARLYNLEEQPVLAWWVPSL